MGVKVNSSLNGRDLELKGIFKVNSGFNRSLGFRHIGSGFGIGS